MTTLRLQDDFSPARMRPAGQPDRKAALCWQRQYSARLRITDAVIVCAAVALAQFVRFGDSPNTSGYPGPVMTLFSGLFALLWLSSISVFHTRSARII
jgi:hypothetical protein